MTEYVVRVGNQEMADNARAFGARMAADHSQTLDKMKADTTAYLESTKRLFTDAGTSGALPKAGTGTTGADHGKTGHGKGGAGGDDQLQQWEKERQDLKLSHQNFWNEDLAGEIAFWQQKLAILKAETGGTTEEHKKRADEIRSIRQKIFDDSKTLATQARQLALADASETTKIAVDAAGAQFKAVKEGLDAKIEAVKAAAKGGQMSLQAELAALEDLNDQEVANEVAKIRAITAAKLAGLKADEAIYATDPENLKKTQDAEVALVANAQGQITDETAKGVKARQKIEDQAAADYQKVWETRLSGVVSAFGSGLEGMINGTKTFHQTLLSVAQSIESSVLRAVEQMVVKWGAGELAKTLSTRAGVAARNSAEQTGAVKSRLLNFETNEKQIFNDAAGAAAGAYKAMAGIPIIGPALGAGAAAVAFAAVEGFGQIASAEGGWDIPGGINPITQLHQNEMVLPATIAQPFKSMLSDYGSSGGGFGGGHSFNFGDFNVHRGPTTMSDRDFQKALADHRDHVTGAVADALRGGYKPRHSPTGLL